MKTLLLLLLASGGLHAQTLITITGPVNKSNGTGWTGKILLSNPDMICGAVTVPAGSQVLTVTAGVLSATIYATADCLPVGSSYLAEYTPADLSLPSRWTIATSPTTLAVSAIQSAGTAKPDSAIALARLGFGSVADGEYLRRSGNNWIGGAPGGGAWGTITGLISAQGDLWTLLGGKESAISFGTSAQFWRGDKMWATLNTLAVPELTNLYHTDARARAALVTSGTAAPMTTPASVGLTYIEETTPLVYISVCTTSSACWQDVASSTGLANAAVDFTAQTVVTIPHNYNSNNVLAECQNASGKRVFGAFDYSDLNNTVVTFAVAQTGRCKANASGGGGGGGGGYTLPTQTGNGTKALITDGTTASWQDIGQLQGRTVASTAPTDTQALVWNAAQSRWEPGTVAGGGGTTYTAGTALKLTGTVFSLDGAATALVSCQAITPPAWSSIASGRSQTQTVAAAGFMDADAVFVGAHNTLAAGLFAFGRSGAATVDISVFNATAGSLTPATLPFTVCFARHF